MTAFAAARYSNIVGKRASRGRILICEDLEHYCKVATALKETIRLMAEIDLGVGVW